MLKIIRITTIIIVLMMSLVIIMPGGSGLSPDVAYAADDTYVLIWGKDISETDLQKMADKWPDYEPLRCNGWMTEVMKEVYKIPMSMGDWVIGTRTNFRNNSTVKPEKIIAGTYDEIKKNMDKVKPGDIVFFNYSDSDKGTWSHVAIMGEDDILWHCTATSPGSKTGKYMTLDGWMKKYGGPDGEHGSPGTYAEVWRVLSSFSSNSTIEITRGNYNGEKKTASYYPGKRIVIRERIEYTASGPIVGKKIKVSASLNKNRKTSEGRIAGTKVAFGERIAKGKKLRYTLKESGTMDIYYKLYISPKRLNSKSTMTPQTVIKMGSETLDEFTEAESIDRTVHFRKQ